MKLIGRELASRGLRQEEPVPPLIGMDLAEYQDPTDLALMEKLYEDGP